MRNLSIESSAMGHSSSPPLSSSSLLLLLPILVLFSSTLPFTSAYFADWSSFAERDRQPTCVDIPSNMTLCQNIGGTGFIFNFFFQGENVSPTDACVPYSV